MFDWFTKWKAAQYSNKRKEIAKQNLKNSSHAKKNAMEIREMDAQTQRNLAEIKVIEAAYKTGMKGLRADTKRAIQTLRHQSKQDHSGNLLSGVEGNIRARLSGG